jgi:hypothetical protein
LGATSYNDRQFDRKLRKVSGFSERKNNSFRGPSSALLCRNEKNGKELLHFYCSRPFRYWNSLDSLRSCIVRHKHKRMAQIELYFEHPHRKLLTLASNDATGIETNPRPDDSGNWTGCMIGVGYLVGTHRDISACLLSDHLGRPATVYDLRALSKQDVIELFRKYFWDKLGADSLPDQDVANIATQTFAHAGNVRLIQLALNDLGENLSVDGVSGPNTRSALLRQTRIRPVAVYNKIRDKMAESYAAAGPVYAGPFLSQLDQFWARKDSMNKSAGLVFAAVAAVGLYYFLNQ